MNMKILLVDDEEDIRDVLQLSLSDMGYDVITAENGQEALDLFEKTHPAIVMTDIKMPVMDGIELLRRVKQANPDTEVVMITGHGDMDLAIESLKYDAVDFITKPINVDILEIALSKVVEKIVTRQKLNEYTHKLEALVKEKAELKDHLSSLGLMIGSISHGLKGYLTGLDGGMYQIRAGCEKENLSKVKEGYSDVALMIERIRKMILDILFYAKKRELRLKKISAAVFAAEVADAVEAKIIVQGIDFVRRFDPCSVTISLDPDYMQAALINVFDNAVDACLKDTARTDHRIIFGLSAGKDEAVFEIHDNGIGMDRATRDRIFELFYSSKGRRGTGLGLFICDKIVRQHGGRTRVASIPGQETRFMIHLPLQDRDHSVRDENQILEIA